MKGTITRLFRGCPKPSGWFGCFFEPAKTGGSIKITGMVQTLGVQTLEEGMQLDVDLTPDPNWENIVTAGSVVTTSRSGIIAYLSSENFRGIGRTKAVRLYNAFKDDVLSVIETDPDKLKAIGMTDRDIRSLTAGVANQALGNQLQKILFGLSQSDFKRITDFYRGKLTSSSQIQTVVARIKSNPYTLLYDMRADIGLSFAAKLFASVDDYAKRTGVSPTDDMRLDAAIDLATRKIIADSNGAFLNLADIHDKEIFDTELDSLLHVTPANRSVFDAAIPLRVRPKLVTFQNAKCLYDPSLLDAELTCAKILNERMAAKPYCRFSLQQIDDLIADYEQEIGHVMDPLQKNAVRTSLTSGISVITGGPGRGKTSVIDCIVYIWKHQSDREVILSAPTGAAAKRMYQAITNGRQWPARTIAYRLLRQPPIKQNLCIIDEASMLCLRDAAKTLKLFRACQIIFVGDTDQLPSVENGQFLKDLCESGKIPVTMLTKCYRTAPGSAAILSNADCVNQGRTVKDLTIAPQCFTVETQGKSGVITDNEAMGHAARAYLDRHQKDGVPLKHMCLISPMRDTINQLNDILRETLNPPVAHAKYRAVGTASGQEFVWDTKGHPIPEADPKTKYPLNMRVGDRIVITKNLNSLSLVNGDTGTIKDYRVPEAYSLGSTDCTERPYLTFVTDQGQRVFLPQENFQDTALAYAVTVHKAQGCEYPHIMIVAPHKLCNYMLINSGFTCRNLLYTAITRAKQTVEMFGSEMAIGALMRNAMKPRPSLLQQRLSTPALISSNTGFDFSLYNRVLDMEPELDDEETMADDAMYYDDGEDFGLPDAF